MLKPETSFPAFTVLLLCRIVYVQLCQHNAHWPYPGHSASCQQPAPILSPPLRPWEIYTYIHPASGLASTATDAAFRQRLASALDLETRLSRVGPSINFSSLSLLQQFTTHPSCAPLHFPEQLRSARSERALSFSTWRDIRVFFSQSRHCSPSQPVLPPGALGTEL